MTELSLWQQAKGIGHVNNSKMLCRYYTLVNVMCTMCERKQTHLLSARTNLGHKAPLDIISSHLNAPCHMFLLSATTRIPRAANPQHRKHWEEPAATGTNINQSQQTKSSKAPHLNAFISILSAKVFEKSLGFLHTCSWSIKSILAFCCEGEKTAVK